MIIRLTEKLGRKIGIMPTELLPMTDNPYLDWSAHLFRAGRNQYIILTNTPSLYSIVMIGRGCKSGSTLQQNAIREMWEHMRLNDTPMSFLGYDCPRNVFRDMRKQGQI